MDTVKLNGSWGISQHVLSRATTYNDSDFGTAHRSGRVALESGTSASKLGKGNCRTSYPENGNATGRDSRLDEFSSAADSTIAANTTTWMAPSHAAETQRVFHARQPLANNRWSGYKALLIIVVGVSFILGVTATARSMTATTAWEMVNADTLETPFRNLALLPTSPTRTFANTRQKESEYIRHLRHNTVEVLSSSFDFFFPHGEFVNTGDAKQVDAPYHRRIVSTRESGTDPTNYANVAAIDSIARFDETEERLSGRLIVSALDTGKLHEVAAFDAKNVRMHSATVVLSATEDNQPAHNTTFFLDADSAGIAIKSVPIVTWNAQGTELGQSKTLTVDPGGLRIRRDTGSVPATHLVDDARAHINSIVLGKRPNGQIVTAPSKRTTQGIPQDSQEPIQLDQLVLSLLSVVRDQQERIEELERARRD